MNQVSLVLFVFLFSHFATAENSKNEMPAGAQIYSAIAFNTGPFKDKLRPILSGEDRPLTTPKRSQLILDRVAEANPSFFARFEQEMTSGHPQRVQAALEEARRVTGQALGLPSSAENSLSVASTSVVVVVVVTVTVTVTGTTYSMSRVGSVGNDQDGLRQLVNLKSLAGDQLVMGLTQALAAEPGIEI